MTNITRVIKDLIEANTYAEITANVGNTQPVTINSIVYADQTWANTSNTSVTSAGGYIKLYGIGFETNANVLFGSTVSTANVQSANEVRVNVPALSTGTYTMFLYNPSGSNAIKYKSIPVQGDYNYGWFIGGMGGSSGTSILSSVERIQFSNDTVNTDIRGSLPFVLVFSSVGGTKDNAYTFGGSNSAAAALGPSTTNFNTGVHRLTYANDETSLLYRAGISPATQRWRVTTSSKNYAYTSGGFFETSATPLNSSPPAVSNTDRLNFSNDSQALTARGPLSLARMKFSSTSNDTYGWYIGGSSGAYFYTNSPSVIPYSSTLHSLVDRLNFNSDTTTAVVRGPLTQSKSFSTSTKNIDYAWISGGFSSYSYTGHPGAGSTSHNFGLSSNIQRMTFSSDNLQMVVRVPTSSPIAQAGAGDENYGWFTGGLPNVGTITNGVENNMSNYAPVISTTTRLDYSSDTTAAGNRNTFFQARKFHTGISGVVS